MPRRALWNVGSRSMRSPSNQIWPELGAVTPAIMLNSVLLPAPFGPITALISPALTLKLKSATAVTPSKWRDSPSTCSSFAVMTGSPAEGGA